MLLLESTYRPYRSGSVSALIHARSSGHYIVPKDWEDTRMRKDFLEFYWCVSGCGEFCCEKQSFLLNAGEVCFYFPGDHHEITAKTQMEYYWLTVDGPDLELLISTFQLTRFPRRAGDCPISLFCRLKQELRDASGHGEFRAGAIVYEILSQAMAGSGAESQKLKQFKKIVEEEFQNPDLDVGMIAQKMGLHRSTLTRCLQQQCGISPVEYLLSFRLQEVLRLLNDTTFRIKEIALCSGFRDQNYLAKVMVRRLGKPPSAFRR
ncbi:MAG: AraC family transcriptional regulator [Victivallaceae bacterium]|nr:AraC family transcriptional regulator [Victivallaceae bacterium]